MLLESPQSFLPAYCTGLIVCVVYGGVCSMPTVWNKLFPKLPDGSMSTGSYLKAGEYGETELNNNWSVFKEPLNAWTSLAYSLFGIVIVYVGCSDFYLVGAPNRLSMDPIFSVMFGLFCMYLGMASFLFHASHSEVWRKADAGMTSGTILPMVTFGLWDRLRPPGVTSSFMVGVSVLLLASLTYGYLPYGSSDVLLPALVAFMWIVELYPRYGGVVDAGQYTLWLRCFFAVAGAALLRATDIKRHAPTAKRNLLVGYTALLVGFTLALGPADPVILCGVVCGAVTWRYPEKGHVAWHFGSAFALYVWWYMLRVRPGDPLTAYGADTSAMTIVFFVAVKNAVRRIFMNAPLLATTAQQDRVRSLIEHSVFTVWGYHVLTAQNVVRNTGAGVTKAAVQAAAAAAKAASSQSVLSTAWLYNAQQCWEGGGLAALGDGVDDLFHLFYLARAGAFLEEVLFQYLGKTAPSSGPSTAAASSVGAVATGDKAELGSASVETDSLLRPADAGSAAKPSSLSPSMETDPLLSVHNIVSALLAVTSYYTGYLRIGLLVMLLHDASDLPLDALRLLDLRGAVWKNAQSIALCATILSWLYWRVWVFASVVLVAVAVDSKSMLAPSPCAVGSCTWAETPERGPFLGCLLLLLGMHLVWIRRMVDRARREIPSTTKTNY